MPAPAKRRDRQEQYSLVVFIILDNAFSSFYFATLDAPYPAALRFFVYADC